MAVGKTTLGKIVAKKKKFEFIDTDKEIEKQTQEYQDKFANPFVAASRGYLDDIITPHNTRKKISLALELLKSKKLTNPKKKHGNIPL